MTKSQFMKKYINDYYDKKFKEKEVDQFQGYKGSNVLNKSAKYRRRLNVRC